MLDVEVLGKNLGEKTEEGDDEYHCAKLEVYDTH